MNFILLEIFVFLMAKNILVIEIRIVNCKSNYQKNKLILYVGKSETIIFYQSAIIILFCF